MDPTNGEVGDSLDPHDLFVQNGDFTLDFKMELTSSPLMHDSISDRSRKALSLSGHSLGGSGHISIINSPCENAGERSSSFGSMPPARPTRVDVDFSEWVNDGDYVKDVGEDGNDNLGEDPSLSHATTRPQCGAPSTSTEINSPRSSFPEASWSPLADGQYLLTLVVTQGASSCTADAMRLIFPQAPNAIDVRRPLKKHSYAGPSADAPFRTHTSSPDGLKCSGASSVRPELVNHSTPSGKSVNRGPSRARVNVPTPRSASSSFQASSPGEGSLRHTPGRIIPLPELVEPMSSTSGERPKKRKRDVEGAPHTPLTGANKKSRKKSTSAGEDGALLGATMCRWQNADKTLCSKKCNSVKEAEAHAKEHADALLASLREAHGVNEPHQNIDTEDEKKLTKKDLLRTRIQCQWMVSDEEMCTVDLTLTCLGKHFGSVAHFRYQVPCEKCGELLSRNDSRGRHEKTCRGKQVDRAAECEAGPSCSKPRQGGRTRSV